MVSYLRFMAVFLAMVLVLACGSQPPAPAKTGEAPAEAGEAGKARPSNPGGPGKAIELKGVSQKGAELFRVNCMRCHNAEGKGGIANPGSEDGTVPVLNPIDPTLYSKDAKEFAQNIDLFIEHGSTPAGKNPPLQMPAFGAQRMLTQQQIADVIAYCIGLNKK